MCLLLVFTLLLLHSPISLPTPDIPQMEVLFSSSDSSNPWPPEGTAESDPPAKWPGHKEQLAKRHPRVKVDVASKEGFPSAQDFYTNFVERKRPVIFGHAVDNKDYDFLSLEKLNSSGRAALSFVEISSVTSKEKEADNIWKFANNMMSKTFFVSDNLHNNYKSLFKLPSCLQCTYLVDLLVETSHILMGHVYPLLVKQNKLDVLHCQVDGSKEMLLVDNKEYPEVESILDLDMGSNGRASLLNSLAVDYEMYPALTRVKQFHLAMLGPGDCIYIPAGWITQSNILSLENSVELKWTSSPWTPDSDCSKGVKSRFLSSLSFPGEKYIGVDPTLDKKGLLVDKVSRILDKLLREKKSLSFAQFMAKLVKDDVLLPDMQDWTVESTARTKEMFSTLDMNLDNMLDYKDVEMVNNENIPILMGRMEDRLADLMDMIMDQRVDFSLAHETAKSRSAIAKQILDGNTLVKDEL